MRKDQIDTFVEACKRARCIAMMSDQIAQIKPHGKKWIIHGSISYKDALEQLTRHDAQVLREFHESYVADSLEPRKRDSYDDDWDYYYSATTGLQPPDWEKTIPEQPISEDEMNWHEQKEIDEYWREIDGRGK